MSGDASDEDDLLVPREKTKDELQCEEEEYQEFLRREVGEEDLRQLIEVDQDVINIHENPPIGQGDDDGKKKKKKDKGKEKEKGRPKTKEEKGIEDQEFLMKFVLPKSITLRPEVTWSLYSYILNRGWIDRSAKRLPTYTEVTSTRNRKKKFKAKGSRIEGGAVTGSSGSSSESEADDGSKNMDEDEFDDVADVFESSYNFRFEEPYVLFLQSWRATENFDIHPAHRNATEIARHPRNLTSTVRRQETTRKEARARRNARKEEELLQKREEVKRLKALKMKELRRKLERISREGGLQGIDEHQGIIEPPVVFHPGANTLSR